ncbi:MAG: zf-TFIIB domain-containing protein [Thermodesulfobacteriota bacterium]
MRCPKCKTIELPAGGAFSSAGNRAGSCPSCGGIWIQSSDFPPLRTISESPRKIHRNREKRTIPIPARAFARMAMES